jgi:hypothetical protein
MTKEKKEIEELFWVPTNPNPRHHADTNAYVPC